MPYQSSLEEKLEFGGLIRGESTQRIDFKSFFLKINIQDDILPMKRELWELKNMCSKPSQNLGFKALQRNSQS